MMVAVSLAGKEVDDFLPNIDSSPLLFFWLSNSMSKPYLSLVPVFPVCSSYRPPNVFTGVICFLLLSSSNKSSVLNCPSISCNFSESVLHLVASSCNFSEHPAAFGTLKYSSSSPESSS